MMLSVYHSFTKYSAPALRRLLQSRLRRSKEDPARLSERMGQPGLPRPPGKLVWFHAASIGEAQSTLVLVRALLALRADLSVLVTTGTVTSAAFIQQRLPERVLHQFYPLDHPQWVARFLDHWKPDLIIWMESELWPNMLREIRERRIPAVLMNARLSRRSYRRWKKIRGAAAALLSTFEFFLAQTKEDAESFIKLGGVDVRIRDNLKYSAAPLACDALDLAYLKAAAGTRPLWLYASSHDGEEELACMVHAHLKAALPDLLTIIVPRHPERGAGILSVCAQAGRQACLRGKDKKLPQSADEIYIADTIGELGLFYTLAPVACLGRSFSRDGGGGHNPIEAVQLGCAVLHGPNVQNLAQIYAEIDQARAALCVPSPGALAETLGDLLQSPDSLIALQATGEDFARSKAEGLSLVLQDLRPLLIDTGILGESRICA